VIPNPINDALRIKIAAHEALSKSISRELDQWIAMERQITENAASTGALDAAKDGNVVADATVVEQTISAVSKTIGIPSDTVKESFSGVKLEEILPKLPTISLTPEQIKLLQKCTTLPADIPAVTVVDASTVADAASTTLSTSNVTHTFSSFFGKPLSGKSRGFGLLDGYTSQNASFLSDISFSGQYDHDVSMDMSMTSMDHSMLSGGTVVNEKPPVIASLSGNIRKLCKSIIFSHNMSIFKLLSMYNKVQDAIKLRQHIANVFSKHSLPVGSRNALSAMDALLQISK